MRENTYFGAFPASMDTLTFPERRAIEKKYFGHSHVRISESIGVPKRTVDEWFSERGRLSPYYVEWSTNMNGQREARIREQFFVLDEEWLALIRAIIRRFNQQLLDGHILSVLDLFRVWKMWRVMKNQPTNITSTICRSCRSDMHHFS